MLLVQVFFEAMFYCNNIFLVLLYVIFLSSNLDDYKKIFFLMQVKQYLYETELMS